SSTQPAFYVGKSVTLSAGYASGSVFVIFKGKILQARNLRQDVTDTVLAILATDGDTPRNYAVVNKSLSAGYTYYDRAMVAADAMQALGLGLGYVDKDALTKTKFPRGFAAHGMAKDHLREIAFATRTSWSIQNGKLQILANDKPLPGSAIVLNGKTGLVGMPVQTINGVEGQCLLNGNIVPGSVVQIDQSSVQQAEYDPSITGAPNNAQLDAFGVAADGQYKVMAVSHSGDTCGEPFFTQFIGVKLSAGSVSPALASRGIGYPG
ncbi:hypothetical protein MKK75_23205, partial [Methylobacterium sp. J-030]|uniref:baseplate hub protein n=1 Tax=Methylobacterium sp. J-030 TaxID=2836627 RepID=UPI001FB9D1BB